MRSRFSALLLFLLAFPALPSAADSLRSDILYTRQGAFVQVKPMRPLALDAHDDQFAYEPLGLEIAVTGWETQGDKTYYFVKVLDARTGHEIERLTQTSSSEDDKGFRLVGWSGSGKYLLLEQHVINNSDEPGQYLRWDVSADPPTTQEIVPTSALPRASHFSYTLDFPSPTCRWVLFEQRYEAYDEDGKVIPEQTAYLLYDPERDTFRPLTLPQKAWMSGWADAKHLRVRGERQSPGSKRPNLRLDIATGQLSPSSGKPFALLASPSASTLYSDLTLDMEGKPQSGVQGGRINSFLLWIRRTPTGKLALGVASAGLIPGDDDPQAVWSPNGKQIAFLAHGDLYVTDLVTTDPIPDEKLALGLPLTCPEERQLALSRLKQIGLGLIQYIQDDDEMFPPADGIDESIYPYLKDRSLFSIGGSHWIYIAPKDLHMAAMNAPAEVEIGTLDTPCGHNVLYADGHVKSFPPKQETAP